jgi:MFS family permease
MFTPYRRVLGLPGALLFSLSGLVARLPISMISLGIVLLVSTRTGSYSLAGTVSAAFLVANAALAVPQARLVDRVGQRRVLPVAVAVFSVGMVGVMVVVQEGLGSPWPHLCAALAGAAMPQIGACVRARWSHLVADKAELNTAFAFEAVVDETVFILGPALVTTLATAVHPLAGLGTAVVAALVGTSVLVAQRRSEPPAGGRRTGAHRGSLRWRVLGPLVGCAAALGVLLGSTEVSTVAFSDEQGVKVLSGLALGIWALGSLLSGLVTGMLSIRAAHATRFRWSMVAMGVLMVPLPFVDSFALLVVNLFLAGFAISPTMIASMAWIEETVPADRLTEGITMFTTGLAIGLAPGAALAGQVVDDAGASASFWVAVGAGLLAAVLAAGTSLVPTAAAPSPSGSSA